MKLVTVLVAAGALWACAPAGAQLGQGPQGDPPSPAPSVTEQEEFEEENAEARPDATDLEFQEVTHESHSATLAGLAYLTEQQHPDGSVGISEYRIAVTALAGLAWLSSGSNLSTGEFAPNVRRAAEFFLSLPDKKEDSWNITVSSDNSRMHGHGFATLFLAECYGTHERSWPLAAELESGLRAAVQLSVTAQEKQGGWGYVPRDRMHEGSITVTQLQALRAARDAGIHVPKSTIDRALDYLEKSKFPDADGVYFVYRLGVPSERSFPLTAAAISSLNAVGKYRTDTVDKGLKFLRRYLPGVDTRSTRKDMRYQQFWYYGQLYAVQAMFQSGGTDWELWYPAIRDELVKLQNQRTGAWGESSAEAIYGPAYATAAACIILQLPNRLLPILQR